MSSPQKGFSRWCFYLHHYCFICLGLYPFQFDPVRNLFRRNMPMLVITISSKLLFVTTKAYSATRFMKHFSSIPGSLLPLILYFAIDKLVLAHEILLMITQLTNSKGYLTVLNDNLALEERLKMQFAEVQIKPSRVYIKVFPLKMAFIGAFCVIAGSLFDEPHAAVNFCLFMSSAVYNDQFLIWMENVERSFDILYNHLDAVRSRLSHVVSSYGELDNCNDFHRIAVAHSRIYQHFRSALKFYSAQMMIMLLLATNALLLLMFMEFGFIYYYLYDKSALLRSDFRGVALMAVMWLIILIMIKRCTGVVEKQKKLFKLLQRLAFLKFKDGRLRQMVLLLMFQMKHETIKVEIWNMVEIDYQIVLKILAFINYYLVLLIQFHLQSRSSFARGTLWI